MLNGLFFQQLVKQCRLSQTVPDCARLAALRFCALMSRSSSGEADLDTVGSRQGSSQPQATLPCPSLSHLDIPRPCHTMSKMFLRCSYVLFLPSLTLCVLSMNWRSQLAVCGFQVAHLCLRQWIKIFEAPALSHKLMGLPKLAFSAFSLSSSEAPLLTCSPHFQHHMSK